MASSGTLNLRSTWNKNMSEIKNMHPYGLNMLCYSPMVQAVMSQQDIKHFLPKSCWRKQKQLIYELKYAQEGKMVKLMISKIIFHNQV
jgi:hypothetical protein